MRSNTRRRGSRKSELFEHTKNAVGQDVRIMKNDPRQQRQSRMSQQVKADICFFHFFGSYVFLWWRLAHLAWLFRLHNLSLSLTPTTFLSKSALCVLSLYQCEPTEAKKIITSSPPYSDTHTRALARWRTHECSRQLILTAY